MADLQPADVQDLIKAVLTNQYKNEVINLMSNLQRHPSYEFMRRAKQTRGSSLTWTVAYRDNNSARTIGLFDRHNPDVIDLTAQATVPWRGLSCDMAHDVAEVQMMQGAPEQIFDLIKVRQDAAWSSYNKKVEQQIFNRPQDSSDTDNAHGLLYYVTMENATTTFGQNGGEITGFAGGVGGLLSTTATPHKNWNYIFTNADYDDLGDAMRDSTFLMDYETPYGIDYVKNALPQYMYFTGLSNIKDLGNIAKDQNTQVGWDIGLDKKMTFYGMSFRYTPTLDNSAYNRAVYFIDMNDAVYTAIKGSFMRQNGPVSMGGGQQDTILTQWVTRGNLKLKTRRNHAVFATAAFGTGRLSV